MYTFSAPFIGDVICAFDDYLIHFHDSILN